ncbi:MAG: hypothetical protein HY762_07025 [Planctomycetes bacterium]|nr:hypothetical protein [Planctomycetota bacterium]
MARKLHIILLLAWLLTGCAEQPKPPVTQVTTLRIGAPGGPPKTLLPVNVESTVAQPLLQLIYNGLLKMNQEMSLIPDLAESYEMSDDGLVWTFHLRPGVRFHDGIEMSADDVAFTYKIMKETPSFRQRCYTMIARVELPDRYTVKVVLSQPFGISATALIEPILPKHLLEDIVIARSPGRTTKQSQTYGIASPSARNDRGGVSFAHMPIGTGPFKVVDWTSDDRIILERNPDYYELRIANGPYGINELGIVNSQLARIEARGYESPDDLYSAFIKGETDIAFYLSAEQFDKVGKDERFQTYKFPYIMTYAMEYNLAHPLFKDKDVRYALAHAVNIPAMIKKIDGGYGGQSTGSFTPGTWWFNPDVKPLEYNPAKAMEMLNSAGWQLNKDNVLEKDGKEFRFVLLVNTDLREGNRIAMLLHNNLFGLGIRVEIEDFDLALYSAGKISVPADAAAYLTFFSTMDAPTELDAYWDSRRRHPFKKLWPYDNQRINELFDSGRQLSGSDKGKQVYQQLHQTIYDDQPALFLYFHYNLSAVRKKFDNTDKLFTVPMPFWTIKDWK